MLLQAADQTGAMGVSMEAAGVNRAAPKAGANQQRRPALEDTDHHRLLAVHGVTAHRRHALRRL